MPPGSTVAFTNALETLLANRHEIGDGELYRNLRELQKKYFHPPPVGTWS